MIQTFKLLYKYKRHACMIEITNYQKKLEVLHMYMYYNIYCWYTILQAVRTIRMERKHKYLESLT